MVDTNSDGWFTVDEIEAASKRYKKPKRATYQYLEERFWDICLKDYFWLDPEPIICTKVAYADWYELVDQCYKSYFNYTEPGCYQLYMNAQRNLGELVQRRKAPFTF